MRSRVVIEDIEAVRREQGINDDELREQLRGLRVGDLVRITLLCGAAAGGETVPVRITRVRGSALRGELTRKPASSALSGLRAGSPVAFAAAQVHSLADRHPAAAPEATCGGTRANPPARPSRAGKRPTAAAAQTIPGKPEERLRLIGALGERVQEHVRFICGGPALCGTSAESRERAVAAFCTAMVALERELGRISEELRLG